MDPKTVPSARPPAWRYAAVFAAAVLLTATVAVLSAPDCHLLRGATFGLLGDGRSGAREYERFVELAPNHPKAPSIPQLLEAYRHNK